MKSWPWPEGGNMLCRPVYNDDALEQIGNRHANVRKMSLPERKLAAHVGEI